MRWTVPGESSLIYSQENTNCKLRRLCSPKPKYLNRRSRFCSRGAAAGTRMRERPQQLLVTYPEAGWPREPPAAPLPTCSVHRAPRLPRGAPTSLRPPAAARIGLPLPMPLPARQQRPPLPLPRPARLPPQWAWECGATGPGPPHPQHGREALREGSARSYPPPARGPASLLAQAEPQGAVEAARRTVGLTVCAGGWLGPAAQLAGICSSAAAGGRKPAPPCLSRRLITLGLPPGVPVDLGCRGRGGGAPEQARGG